MVEDKVIGRGSKPGDYGNTFEMSESLKSLCEKGFKFSVSQKVLPEFEPPLFVDEVHRFNKLTWEALRCVPEGGVYACTYTVAHGDALRDCATGNPSPYHPRSFFPFTDHRFEGASDRCPF